MRPVPGARAVRALVRLLASFALAAGAIASTAGPALAEGSAQLYPTNATCAPNSSGGSCRANIEWRTDAYGPSTGAQVRRRSYMQVYAQAGEVLEMGSSAVGVGAGDILIYNPGVVTDSNAEPLPTITTGVNGFRCSDQRTSSGVAAQGMITSRTEELAGPQAADGSGNLTGYVPCYYVAPVTGIYGVAFYGPSGDGSATDGGVTGEIDLTSASNFTTAQGSSVAAWDLTVRSSLSSTTNITGRLFTKALIAFTAGNGRPINVSLEVVTQDGFRYRTDTRGLDPNGFAFYGNERGFLNADGTSPLYHDAYGTTNSSELTALAGGVTFAAPEYPIFFNSPDPATLTALGIPVTPVAPTISALSFAGNVSGSTSSIGVGGTFSYTANVSGVYQIVISRDGVNFDPGNSQNRVLSGVGTAGTQTITWNGKDNSGNNFPVGANYAVRASLHAGEYHFPLLDAENSTLGGPTFTLLNPPGGVCPFGGSCTTAFFDDRGYTTDGPTPATVGTAPPPDTALCGTAPPPAPDHSDPVTGYDSSGTARAYGIDNGGNTNVPCTGSFGDVKGLDTWTYFPSSSSSSSLAIVESADVSITKTHVGSFTVGQSGAYTLTVANAGPVGSGAITVTDPLPAGVGYVSASGTGWVCGASGSNVSCTNSAGLASGGSSVITLTVSIGPAAAPSTTNTASVSATEFDPNTVNNQSSDTASVTPIPIAVDDTASTTVDTAVAIAVLTNDTIGVGPTSITSYTAPTHGSVTCTASTCTYTPAAGFTGVDTFDYTITDANSRSSTAVVTITVGPPPAADLATTVHGPAATTPGAVVDLSADVRNNGPTTAQSVQVTLNLPAQLTSRAGTIELDGAPAGSACAATTGVVTCQLGALAAGGTVHITWQATVGTATRAGRFVVRSNVSSSTTDSVPANNPSSWTIRVADPKPDPVPPRLTITATPDQKTVRPGGKVRAAVRVRNTGSGVASAVVVCVPAPANSAFVSSPGAGLRDGSECWSVGNLDPGGARLFTVVIRVDSTAAPGRLRLVATVTRKGEKHAVSDPATLRVLRGKPKVRPGGVTG